jgi:hypothetical protein
LTRVSLAMIPATAVSSLVALVVGTALMNATGTPEGQLLTSSGLGGWLSWVFVLLIMMSAPLAGVVLALVARRVGGESRTTLALTVNGVLAAGIALTSVANLIG